jgi:hypothetical protein
LAADYSVPQATEMNAERHDINGFTFEVSDGISVYGREVMDGMISIALGRCGLWFSPMTNWHLQVENDGFTSSADCQNVVMEFSALRLTEEFSTTYKRRCYSA